MLPITINGHTIAVNPLLDAHKNLTHQMLLKRHRPDLFEMFKRLAEEPNKAYRAKLAELRKADIQAWHQSQTKSKRRRKGIAHV